MPVNAISVLVHLELEMEYHYHHRYLGLQKTITSYEHKKYKYKKDSSKFTYKVYSKMKTRCEARPMAARCCYTPPAPANRQAAFKVTPPYYPHVLLFKYSLNT